MGVGQAQRLQHALNAAVLAPSPVQRIEHHIRPVGGQDLRQITARIDAVNLCPQPLQCIGTFTP